MQVWGFVGLRLVKNRRKLWILMVGAEGFEPPTLCSQSRCATRLRYAPTVFIDSSVNGDICAEYQRPHWFPSHAITHTPPTTGRTKTAARYTPSSRKNQLRKSHAPRAPALWQQAQHQHRRQGVAWGTGGAEIPDSMLQSGKQMAAVVQWQNA